jgi:hypothetical protein
VFENGALWTVLLAIAAVVTASFAVSAAVHEDWFEAVFLAAGALLIGEGALRGIGRFRFGLATAVWVLLWAGRAVIAVSDGDWFVAGLSVVCGSAFLGLWLAPRRCGPDTDVPQR